MERKAIMNTIGIFTGKQREYNILLLTLLYDNEPLSAWELTAKVTDTQRQSLHATFNKRLRGLEKKGYVHREGQKWFLRFKGIIAVLLIQPEPRMWSPKWTELFKKSAKTVEEYSMPLLGVDKATFQNALNGIKSLDLYLEDYDAWVNLSKKVKELMEKGVINFDIIKDETLLALIIMETANLEQLSVLFKKEEKEE
jgi:hypothetical protein